MMKKGIALALALAGAVLLLALAIGRLEQEMTPASRPIAAPQDAPVILDAGHGGEDGGAVSVTGVSESQINLSIVLKLRDMMALYGIDPVVLRQDDSSLHDQGASTLREKKRSDLQNRVSAIQAVADATLISIHQNTFTDSRYHGTQVFYAPTRESQALAEHVQKAVCSALQPDNRRAAKQIPDTVYLMSHVSCPAILIECGFLTNPQEEALLRDPGYQRQLAAVLTSAWLNRQAASLP